MKPRYVVYQCDNCGRLFDREVVEVLVDDVDHCEVKVMLLSDQNGELEEFPMCECVGGDGGYVIGSVKEAAPSVAA